MYREFLNETADDIIETGTQPSARDNAGGHVRGVEIDLPARPGCFETRNAVGREAVLGKHGNRVLEQDAVTFRNVMRGGLLGGEHLGERRIVTALAEAAHAKVVQVQRHRISSIVMVYVRQLQTVVAELS
jgi:hypothetical protein